MYFLQDFLYFLVYSPPDHTQQTTTYSNSPTTSYASWTSLPVQNSTNIVSPTCWTITSSPTPPHQISASNTPNQSPTHQLYQPNPITNLTNISYPNYYNQDITYSHYQPAEYVSVSDLTYAQLGADRNIPTSYQEEMTSVDKLSVYEENVGAQHASESPGSNSSTPRHEWNSQNHL